MAGDLICNRLDAPVALVGGGIANLGDFCGQKLIVFFCPSGADEAAAEIRAYEALAHQFENSGAWVVGIVGEGFDEIRHASADTRIHLGIDPDGATFRRLAACLPAEARPVRADGATFVIGRDNGVDRAWPRSGHAARALEAARERP